MPRAHERGWKAPAGYFLLGAISLVIQTLLVREAMFTFHGGEIGLGLFFAVWLAGIAGGAAWGARSTSGASFFGVGLSLLPWVGILQIGIFRYHRLLIDVPAGGYLPALPYLALLLLAAAPAGMLTGLLFPIGLRGWRIPPGMAYGFESAGSMLGGAFTALVALPRIPPLVLLAGAAWAVLLWGAPRPRRTAPLLLSGALALALLTGAPGRIDGRWLHARWDSLSTGSRPEVMRDTPYHHITLAERGGERSLYLDGRYVGPLVDPFVDSLDAATIATQHPRPERVLAIAPAFRGAVAVLASGEGVALTLAREDAILAIDGPGVAVTCDPRELVGRDTTRYDLIAILHGGPSSGSSNRFYTAEFFATCASRLRIGGVLAITLPGAANVASPAAQLLRASVFQALRETFREVRIAPGEAHHLFAAVPRGRDGPSPLTWDPDSLAARRARLWPSGRSWPPQHFAAQFPPDRIDQLRRVIASSRIPANRDLRPIVYYEQLRRWDHLSGSGLSGLLGAWHRRPWVWSLALLGVLVVVGYPARRRWGSPIVSLATTGMAGMGADLLLLLLFQTFRGTLYLKVGLVTAVFMCGLAGGAAWGSHRGERDPARDLRLSDTAWVLFLLGLLVVFGWLPRLPGAGVEALIFGLAAAAGMLTAFPFPRAAAAFRAAGRSRDVAGGIADAADHAGAMTGAVLTGTIVIPLLGFRGAVLLLAGVKLLSLASWGRTRPTTGGT